MTGVANMFGLDMIMISVGGWDILVECASIVSVLIIGGIKIPIGTGIPISLKLIHHILSLRHWNWI